VRYAVRSDIDALLPACIDMFTAEVGISPVAHGGGPAYRNRIAELIGQRRSMLRIDEGEVTFKAEVGVVGAGVAQVQGVWLRPDLRGRGLAAPAMAAVVRMVLADIAPTASLYVNDFNAAALALYRRVGFHAVDEFATVLF
jgi:predicted GNAT family acetyltransferase